MSGRSETVVLYVPSGMSPVTSVIVPILRAPWYCYDRAVGLVVVGCVDILQTYLNLVTIAEC